MDGGTCGFWNGKVVQVVGTRMRKRRSALHLKTSKSASGKMMK